MSEKQKRRIRCNIMQKERLVAFMAKNRDLARGSFLGPQGLETQNRKWHILQRQLSQLGPPKTIDQWKITWRDLKFRAKLNRTHRQRQHLNRQHANYVHSNTAEDEAILAIIDNPRPRVTPNMIERPSTSHLPPSLAAGYQKIISMLSSSPDLPEDEAIVLEITDDNVTHKNTHIKSEVDKLKTTDDGGKDRVDPLSNMSSPTFEDEVEIEEIVEDEPETIEDDLSDRSESDQEANVTEKVPEPRRSKIQKPYSTDDLKKLYLRKKVENACLERDKLLQEMIHARKKHQFEMLILKKQLDKLKYG